MALLHEMYDAKVNSPQTSLAQAVGKADTDIPVEDASVFPPGPNLAVIGDGDTAETVRYSGINTNILTGCTRGFEGEAASWQAGTVIARNITAYDLDALNDNVAELSTVMGTKADLVDGTVPTAQLPEESVTSVAGKAGDVALTKVDVGLANVDNTGDLDKPISAAMQDALNGKADKSHTHTKSQVGLANVDNTSDANKPISVAVQTALNTKSDKTHGHTKADVGLSNVTNIGIIFLTESQYEALSSKDPNVLYVRGSR